MESLLNLTEFYSADFHNFSIERHGLLQWLMSFMFSLVWILFFLIEEGFALAQRTKGKLLLKYFI